MAMSMKIDQNLVAGRYAGLQNHGKAVYLKDVPEEDEAFNERF